MSEVNGFESGGLPGTYNYLHTHIINAKHSKVLSAPKYMASPINCDQACIHSTTGSNPTAFAKSCNMFPSRPLIAEQGIYDKLSGRKLVDSDDTHSTYIDL